MTLEAFKDFTITPKQEVIYHSDDKMYLVVDQNKEESLLLLKCATYLHEFWVRCENVTILPF